LSAAHAAEGDSIGLAFEELKGLTDRRNALRWQSRVRDNFALLFELHEAAEQHKRKQRQLRRLQRQQQRQQESAAAAAEGTGRQDAADAEAAAAASAEGSQQAAAAPPAAAAEEGGSAEDMLLADETLAQDTEPQQSQPEDATPAPPSAAAAAAGSNGGSDEDDPELEAELTAQAAAAAAAAAANIPAAQKGSLEEALKLLKLGEELPVDEATLEVLGDAAAAAVVWQKRVQELLPGPKGVPARRGVDVSEVWALIREGQGLPFRWVWVGRKVDVGCTAVYVFGCEDVSFCMYG
jgi:hypothetical protein